MSLEGSVYPEGSAAGRLDSHFLGFPPSSSKCWNNSQVPSWWCVLLTRPSQYKFITIKPLALEASKLYNSTPIQEIKIPTPSSQATATLNLSEGRAGESWEPSNRNYGLYSIKINHLLLLPWFSRSTTLLLLFLTSFSFRVSKGYLVNEIQWN
jgi:hypothetical protein